MSGAAGPSPAGRGGTARLVRTVVCCYTRAELPTSWLQVFRRFEHEVKRAGLRVRVRLEPLEELPESYEVVVVAPELLASAQAHAPEARIVTATRDGAAAAASALVRELVQGETLYAEHAAPDDPVIVVHRGGEIL